MDSLHPGTLPYWSACWQSTQIQMFVRRMHAHGIVVSRTLMLFDSYYALEHLALAHSFADRRLQALAVEMFEHMEWPLNAPTRERRLRAIQL